MRFKYIVYGIAVVIVALLVAGYLVLRSQDFNRHKALVEEAVKDATGRHITIGGDISLSISLNPRLVVEDATLANAPWGAQPQMASIGRFTARIKLLPLVLGDLEIINIELSDASLYLETDAEGRGNWVLSPVGGKSQGFWTIKQLQLEQLRLQDFSVTYRNGKRGSTQQYELEELELVRTIGADALAVTLSGRFSDQEVLLSGQIGTLPALLKGHHFPVTLKGAFAGTALSILGEIGNPLTLDGIDLTVQTEGTDLAVLGIIIGVKLPPSDRFDLKAQLSGNRQVLQAASISGSLSHHRHEFQLTGAIGNLFSLQDLNLELHGKGQNLGELGQAVNAALPDTGPFEVAGRLVGSRGALRMEDTAGQVSRGKLKLKFDGNIDNISKAEGLEMKIECSGASLAELGTMIGSSLPEAGPFEISGLLSGSVDALSLKNARGKLAEKDFELTTQGTVGNLIALTGLNLKARASGKDLPAFGRLFNVTLPTTDSFDIAGRLKGSGKKLVLKDATAHARRGGLAVKFVGGVANLIDFSGLDVNHTLSGQDLAELSPIFNRNLPHTGPFTISGQLKGSTKVLALSGARGSLKNGNVAATMTGGVADLMTFNGVDLSIETTGQTLNELGTIFDAKLPEVGPFRLQARVSEFGDVLNLKEFRAVVDRSDFQGWAKLELKERPKITARLASELIDATPLVGEVNDEAEENTGDADQAKLSLFSDLPLPFDRLNAMDLDLDLKAQHLRLRGAAFKSGQLALQLEDGQLNVDKLEATYKETKVAAALDVKTQSGAPSEVDVKFLVQDFDVGTFMGEIEKENWAESGHMDIAANLTGRGDSPKSLASSLDGTIGAVFGPGHYPRGLDLIAEDLSQRVIPFWGDAKRAGKLNCGVLQFGIQQGIAKSKSFLFDSERSILAGAGEMNFATEQIDFVLAPKPKDPSLLSLSVKLRVTGNLMDPKVRPDATSAAIKGAKALSFFALGPVGLLAPFISVGARQQHACDIQNLETQLEDIYNGTNGAADVLPAPQQ